MAKIFACEPQHIVYLGTESVACRINASTHAWIEIDTDDLGANNAVFPPLTYAEGFEIAGGVIALWALCWVARMLIQTIRQTRYG